MTTFVAAGACTKPAPSDEAPVRAQPPAPIAAVVAAPPLPPAPPPAPAPWYRAELSFGEHGVVPFFVQLPDTTGEGAIKNGDELVAVHVERKDGAVALTAPWNWTARIDATPGPGAEGAQQLEGTWTRDTPMWGRVERDFSARPIATPEPRERFAGDAAPIGDVSGTWRFTFKEHGLGRGELRMTPDGVVSGYLRPGSLPDLRYLEGELQGDKLLLSYFNVNAANLVTATVSKDGRTMKGRMSLTNIWTEEFTAKKVAYFAYENPVRMKAGKTHLTAPGVAKYAGKPVILVIGTTWCPACHDMYPFLVKLYAAQHPLGLEMLSLTYDLSEDQAEIDANLAAYRRQYKVPWEMIAVKTNPERWVKDLPPEIEHYDGFPLIAFIRADGTVEAVYGGWFSEATGVENKQVKAQFETWASELVATPPT